jgi:hypothetical protein
MGRILVSLLVLFPVSASAGPADETTSDCERARKQGKKCELSFDEDELLNGGYISGPERGCSPAEPPPVHLIELRRDFVPELVRSVEDVL